MNKVIPNRSLRFIKLCLISPLFDIITNTVYIITFLILSFEYFDMGNNFSNFEIHQMTKQYLAEDQFKAIKTDTELIQYLNMLLNKLYTFNPNTQVPIMIPLGSVLMIKYTAAKEQCSDLITSVSCNTFQCTTEELGKLYKSSQCGQPYHKQTNKETKDMNNPYDKMIANFNAYYSNYDLFSGGNQLELTIDEYHADQTKYDDFIKDKDLKFLALIFNMKIPSNENYLNVIAAIEMVTYFTHPRTFFSLSIYNIFDPYNAFFLTIFILFSCAVILNLIRLLYEINLKLVLSVHCLSFFNEALNLLILIFTILTLDSTNDMDYNTNQKAHKSHLPYMAIRKYLIIIISMAMLCIPFRILSLISWCDAISKPFVKYMGVVFRMFPGIIISIIVLGAVIYMFSLMNYALYNQYFLQYSSIYNSFLALFNPQIILELLDYNSGGYFSLMTSPYYVIFNLIQLLIIITIIMIFSSSFIYLFGQSSTLEEEKIEDEIMNKINEIEGKLTEGEDTVDTDLKRLRKQVLWLNLNISAKSDLFNMCNEGNELILLKDANRIISFLKYLFAIKPELQFKNLYNKFRILIEVRNDKPTLKPDDVEQIEALVDWLMFVGCKVPVILYSMVTVEKTLKMRLNSKYGYISFTTEMEDVKEFIKEVSNEIVCCKVEGFDYSCEVGQGQIGKQKFYTSKIKKSYFK